MLTAFQVERVAYVGDGEIVCRDCVMKDYDEIDAGDGETSVALDDFESWREDDEAVEAVLGLTPVTRYEMDEHDSASSADMERDPESGHTDDCACTYGVFCDRCGSEIIEPFVDDYAHES